MNGKSETVQSGSKSSINQIHKLGHIRASSNLIIRIRLSVVVVVVVLASALGGGSITLELGAARIARLHKKGQQLPLSVFALPPPRLSESSGAGTVLARLLRSQHMCTYVHSALRLEMIVTIVDVLLAAGRHPDAWSVLLAAHEAASGGL